jgi:histone acetyltransferase (RNA polymerase elongator complex component)
MKKIISIFVPHQGCPHRCIFCHQPHITGMMIRTPITPDDVRRQIDVALAEPKSREKRAQFEVAFYGGTFTGLAWQHQEQLLSTVQPYIDRGDISGIRVSTHPGMFDEGILALLQQYSVHLIELGVQSFDDAVLRQAGRNHTADEVVQTVRRLQMLGIDVGIHLMIGLPGDSFQKSLDSARTTIGLHPVSVRIHPTLVIRGTQLEQLYTQGHYIPLSLEEAVATSKEMLKLFRQHHLPVIRIGLQPTASMEQNIVAGPYHPALRQLIESAIFYDEMVALCVSHAFSDDVVVFYVSPKDVSTVRGQKNTNLKTLHQQFHLRDIHILSDENLQRGQIRIGHI